MKENETCSQKEADRLQLNNDACELLADMIAAESCFPPIFKLDEDKTSQVLRP